MKRFVQLLSISIVSVSILLMVNFTSAQSVNFTSAQSNQENALSFRVIPQGQEDFIPGEVNNPFLVPNKDVSFIPYDLDSKLQKSREILASKNIELLSNEMITMGEAITKYGFSEGAFSNDRMVYVTVYYHKDGIKIDRRPYSPDHNYTDDQNTIKNAIRYIITDAETGEYIETKIETKK